MTAKEKQKALCSVLTYWFLSHTGSRARVVVVVVVSL